MLAEGDASAFAGACCAPADNTRTAGQNKPRIKYAFALDLLFPTVAPLSGLKLDRSPPCPAWSMRPLQGGPRPWPASPTATQPLWRKRNSSRSPRKNEPSERRQENKGWE